MKAYIARSYGGREVMMLGELPDPVPCRGEVVVAVETSSVNPLDWKVRDGAMKLLTGFRFPKVYGCDVAGIVHALGPEVTGFSVSDLVYGFAPIMLGKPGAHAEKVAVAAKHLRRLPTGINFEQAAALPVTALTALNGLRKCGDLTGKTVVVNGATGGVGHFALQIAKARGAKVTAVCSGRNADRAKSLGAEAVIDYKVEDFTRKPEHYHVVFDAFGQVGFNAASRVLLPRGIYVTTLPNAALVGRSLWQKVRGEKAIAFANMRDKQEDYAELESYIAKGSVAPVIDKVFSLDQAAEAFALQEAGGCVGKIIIRIRSAS
jgi:NADPH:quinone reductase-like Zn-dependent oxidoreductase